MTATSPEAGEGKLNLIYFDKLNPYSVEIFLYKPWRPKVFFNLKSSYTSLALSTLFDYLCCGSTAIILY